MMKQPTYYLLNETCVDEDINRKHNEILHENVYEAAGRKLYTLTFKQVLQSFGVRNWNGRVYTRDTVMNALQNNPLVQNDLKMGTWSSEFGHPLLESASNPLARQMTIFPPNVCAVTTKYWEEGNLLMGECTTVAGGYGDILRDRILTGHPAMASSRAIGGCDKSGKVLPGYSIICFDFVERPSHKEAYMVPGSEKVNEFDIPTPQGNTMSESAVVIDQKSESFKNFLLSESSSRDQINQVCDTFGIDANSMVITENAIKYTIMNENGLETIVLPLNKVINANYYQLFQ